MMRVLLAILAVLWIWPAIWDGLVFLFSKRPRSLWGRISMNLIIATLLAVIFEDLWELFKMFARIVIWAMNR